MAWLDMTTRAQPASPAVSAERPVLILPGLGDSEPAHWQSHWERDLPGAQRVLQTSWDRPALGDWLDGLEAAIRAAPGAVLVAHSLGGLLVAHLAARNWAASVHGALLVAPPDVDDVHRTPEALRGFGPVPLTPLPFPAIVAASRNDPYAGFKRSRAFAAAWGAEFVDLGRLGHVNTAAGVGEWTAGRALLNRLD